MDCDECQERVFDLIEREATDPDTVREILARCPDCQAAFEELKAAMRRAERLPLEEPGAAIDDRILRAAAARAPTADRAKGSRVFAPRWAMAAIALLAVGVGVWAIPREVQLEEDLQPSQAPEMEGPGLPDRSSDEEAGAAVQAVPATNEAPSEGGGSASGRVSPAPKGRESASRGSAPRARPPADLRPAANESALALPAEVDSKSSLARMQAPQPEAVAACRRRVAKFEQGSREKERELPDAENSLALGRCYRLLGELEEARRWLKRAAAEPETRNRAEAALRELAPH